MRKRKVTPLHYYLHDIFEMHLPKDSNIIQSAIEQLLTLPFQNYAIDHVFSFEMDDALVMIRKDGFKQLGRMLVFDPERNKYEVMQFCDCMKSEKEKKHDRNGISNRQAKYERNLVSS